MQRKFFVFTMMFFATSAFADVSINKSIRVADGQTTDSSLTTVNGSIDIGADAEVGGGTRTVNGGIRVGDDSRTENLSSVNGRLRLGVRVTVDGDLNTVNGAITTEEGTVVTGGVESVNGEVDLAGTTVYSNLETVNGSVTLDQGSRVKGDLIVKKVWGNNRDLHKPLRINVRNDSVIEGGIDVEDEDREVIVYLSSGGSVLGQIQGAEVVRD